MPESRYPIQVVRGVPVVTAPVALDQRSAKMLRATLLHLAATGHVTVVIDLSATRTIDAAGRAEVGRAYRHANAEGGDLRIVRTAALAGIVADGGLDRDISPYATVAEAVAETPAVRIVPLRAGSKARGTGTVAPRPLTVALPAGALRTSNAHRELTTTHGAGAAGGAR